MRYVVTECRVWEIHTAESEEQARELAETFGPDTIETTVEKLLGPGDTDLTTND
jgi:hypothetical protein